MHRKLENIVVDKNINGFHLLGPYYVSDSIKAVLIVILLIFTEPCEVVGI